MSCHTSFGYNSLTGNCYSTAPSIAPAAPNHSVQFNELNQFAGDGRFVYDQTIGNLDVPTITPDTIVDQTDSEGTNGQYLTSTGTGIEWVDLPFIPSVSSPVYSVQYNNGGDLGGDSSFLFNPLTQQLDTPALKPTTILDQTSSSGVSGQYLTSTATGIDWVDLPAYPTPGAPITSVQFNDAGVFTGDSDFTYNSTTNTLAVTNIKPTTITDDVNSVGTAGQYLTSTGTGVDWVTLPSYPTPGGVSTNIQFNNAGAFGGSANFVRNLTTGNVNINANLGLGTLAAPADRLSIFSSNATISLQSDTQVAQLAMKTSDANQKQFTLQLNGSANTGDIISIQQGAAFRPVRINPGLTFLDQGRLSIGTNSTNACGLQLNNGLFNRKIVLFEAANDDHQYHGLGINTSTFRFQIPDSISRYAWFAGASSSTSNELMRLSGTGTLSVGETTPAAVAPRIFGLSGTAVDGVGGAWTNQWIMAGSSSATTASGIGMGYNTAGNYGAISCITPGTSFRNIRYNAADQLWFNGTNQSMLLDSTGHLVVGRRSTSLITISKGTGTTASSSYQGYLKVGGAEYGLAAGTRRMIGFGYNTGTNNQPAYIGFEERVTTGDSNGDLVFGTRTLTTGDVVPTERMRIMANGNICIGINTTTYGFEVVGTGLFSGLLTCYGVLFANSAHAVTFSNTSSIRNGNNGFNVSSNAGTAYVMSTFAQPYPFNLANGTSRAFYNYSTYILTISPGNSSSFAGFGRWQFNVQVPVVSGTSGAMALQSATVIGGPWTTVAYTEQYNTMVLRLLYAIDVPGLTTTYFRLVSIGSIHTVNMNNLDCFLSVNCLG